MADNVPITAGVGTNIATDDVGGVHYQQIKLVSSQLDTAEPIGDTDNGASRSLHVDPVPVALTSATTTALAASLIAQASAGYLHKVTGYSAAAGFLQVHNTTTLPANGAIPVIAVPVTAGGLVDLDFGLRGRFFSTGITLALSSTGPTLTIGGSSLFLDALVR